MVLDTIKDWPSSIQYYGLFSVCSGRDSKCEIPFLYNGHLHFECSSNSPVSGDLFGRCPTKLLNMKTREASLKVKIMIPKYALLDSVSYKASDWVRCSSTCPLSSYTSNHQIETHLQALAAEHPLLAQALHLGKSVQGQEILGIRITRGVGEERELLKPRVYLGTFNTSSSSTSRLGTLETCMAMNQ